MRHFSMQQFGDNERRAVASGGERDIDLAIHVETGEAALARPRPPRSGGSSRWGWCWSPRSHSAPPSWFQSTGSRADRYQTRAEHDRLHHRRASRGHVSIGRAGPEERYRTDAILRDRLERRSRAPHVRLRGSLDAQGHAEWASPAGIAPPHQPERNGGQLASRTWPTPEATENDREYFKALASDDSLALLPQQARCTVAAPAPGRLISRDGWSAPTANSSASSSAVMELRQCRAVLRIGHRRRQGCNRLVPQRRRSAWPQSP